VKRIAKSTKRPLQVREVRLNLTAAEFLKLFKRFDAVLVWNATELNDAEYEVIEPS